MKLTRTHKDTLIRLLEGKEATCLWETLGELACAALLDGDGELTEAGRAAAQAELRLQQQARRRRNARARARNAVLSSLGLRRTAAGWE